MEKVGCVFICTCTYSLVIILHITRSTAENISWNVCFEDVQAYVNEYNINSIDRCAENAISKLEKGRNTCKRSCEVTITDLYNDRQDIHGVILRIDDYTFNRHLCRLEFAATDKSFLVSCFSLETGLFWSRSNVGYKRQCFKWNPSSYVCWCEDGFVQIYGNCLLGGKLVGNTCVSDLQCTGSKHSGLCSDGVCMCQEGYFQQNITCYLENVLEAGRCVVDTQCSEVENKRRCVGGRCVCVEGYALIENNCLEANLSLNQSCIVNDQCSGSLYVSCLGEICSCIEGYIAVNSTYCVLIQHGLKEASLQAGNIESTSNSMGPIIGALFGGLLLGIIITSGTVYFMYRRSRCSIDKRRRKEPGVMYAVNETFDDVRDGDTVHYKAVINKSKDTQKNVLNVSPLTRSQESPEYSNTSEKQPVGTVTDDVYNHLNEKEKTQDDDNYDNVCAAAARGHLRDLDD